jgi:hypothetical protein
MFEILAGPVGAAAMAGIVHFLIGAAWYSPSGFGSGGIAAALMGMA